MNSSLSKSTMASLSSSDDIVSPFSPTSLLDTIIGALFSTLSESEAYKALQSPWFLVKDVNKDEWDKELHEVQCEILRKRSPSGQRSSDADYESSLLAARWFRGLQNRTEPSGHVPLVRVVRDVPASHIFAMLLPRRFTSAADGVVAFVEHYLICGRLDSILPPFVVDLLKLRQVVATDAELRFEMTDDVPSWKRTQFPYTGKRLLGSDGPSPSLVAGFISRFAMRLRHLVAPTIITLNRALSTCFRPPAPTRAVLVVSGLISSGKSTFLNALLGVPLFPVSALAETMFPTEVMFDSNHTSGDASATFCYADGSCEHRRGLSLCQLHDALARPSLQHESGVVNVQVVVSLSCCRPELKLLPCIDRLSVIDFPGLGEEGQERKHTNEKALSTMFRHVHTTILVLLSSLSDMTTSDMAQNLRNIKSQVESISSAASASRSALQALALVRSTRSVFPPTRGRVQVEMQDAAETFGKQVAACGIPLIGRGLFIDARNALLLHIIAGFPSLRANGFSTQLFERIQASKLVFDICRDDDVASVTEDAKRAVAFAATQYSRIASTQPDISLKELHELGVRCAADAPRTYGYMAAEVAMLSVLSKISKTLASVPSTPTHPTISESDSLLVKLCVERAVLNTMNMRSQGRVRSFAETYAFLEKERESIEKTILAGSRVPLASGAAADATSFAPSLKVFFELAAGSDCYKQIHGPNLRRCYGMPGGIAATPLLQMADTAGAGSGSHGHCLPDRSLHKLQVLLDIPDLVTTPRVDLSIPIIDCWYDTCIGYNAEHVESVVRQFVPAYGSFVQHIPTSAPLDEREMRFVKLLHILRTKLLRYSGGVQGGLPCGHGVTYEQMDPNNDPIPILECNWKPDAVGSQSRPSGVGAIPISSFVQWCAQHQPGHSLSSGVLQAAVEHSFIIVKFGPRGDVIDVSIFSEPVFAHAYESALSDAVAQLKVRS